MGGELSSSSSSTSTPQYPMAKAVLNKYCISCHSPGGQAATLRLDLSSEKAYVNAGWITPGDIDQSKLIYRLIHYTGTQAGLKNMPVGNATFSQSDYSVLVSWVNALGNVNQPPSAAPFTCTDPYDIAPTPGYALTIKQYTNALEDLFGTAVVTGAKGPLSLLTDEAHEIYSYKRISGLDVNLIDGFHYTALNIANQITANNTNITKVFSSCATVASPTSTCINTYLNGFAQRIFRRPLTTQEKADAVTLVNSGTNYKDGLNTLLAYHLQSPYFIYRLEVGTANDTSSTFSLSPYEVATRVALMATDSIPDAQLLKVAGDGTIADPLVLRAEVKRLLLSTRGKAKLMSVLGTWSGADIAEDYSNLPTDLLNGIQNPNLGQAMVNEAKDFIDYVLYERNGNFDSLMLSKASFASDPDLARIYQHSPANPSRPIGSATAMMGGRRQGLLLRSPALISTIARTEIIHRGVAFQANILCNELPSPPGDIVDMRNNSVLTPAEMLNATNRYSIAYQTNSPACMGCHGKINPTGFAFENFGPLGEIRQQERIFDDNGNYYQSLTVDTADDVPTWNGQTTHVSDAYDLITNVAKAPEGQACFSRKMFRYLNERRETAKDDCQMDKIYQQVHANGGNLIDGFTDLIANESNQRKSK